MSYQFLIVSVHRNTIISPPRYKYRNRTFAQCTINVRCIIYNFFIVLYYFVILYSNQFTQCLGKHWRRGRGSDDSSRPSKPLGNDMLGQDAQTILTLKSDLHTLILTCNNMDIGQILQNNWSTMRQYISYS
jgi:hypothetical protein